MPLTGLEAPMPSFPFTDLHHDLKQPPPRVLHQFVMVLVARFHMSVAEIVMAYAFWSDPTRRTTTPPPAARTPHLNTSLHAIFRSSKHDSQSRPGTLLLRPPDLPGVLRTYLRVR